LKQAAILHAEDVEGHQATTARQQQLPHQMMIRYAYIQRILLLKALLFIKAKDWDIAMT
jgi:hypothetical protein